MRFWEHEDMTQAAAAVAASFRAPAIDRRNKNPA
jgi:hypothetical protein